LEIGDKYSTLAPVAGGGTLLVRPPSGVEVTVMNFYYSGSVELYFTDGDRRVRLGYDWEEGSLQGFWNLTSELYVEMRNPTTVSLVYGYDGVVTKV